MVILSRKKIVYTTLSIFLIVLVCCITLNMNKGNNDYIETVSLSVSGKTVVIDAGHGKPDERC